MDVACVAGGISALNAVWGRPARRIGGGAERRMSTSPIEIPSALGILNSPFTRSTGVLDC